MFRELILTTLEDLKKNGDLPPEVTFEGVVVEPPKDPLHGDMSTNAPLVLGKKVQKNPRLLAQFLCDALGIHPEIEKVSIAGAGFVNMTLKPSYWRHCLCQMLKEGQDYGRNTYGAGEKVNIEYVSANPTGPLHAGHGRVAVVADVVANLLEASGFEVTREYYVNDAGGQIDVLARSTLLRYREALGESISRIPEGYYPGEYLKEVAHALRQQEGDRWLSVPEEKALAFMGSFAVDFLMKEIRQDLDRIGIRQDVFTSEAEIHRRGFVDRAIEGLEKEGLVYEGVLERPKDKGAEGWIPTPLCLFRSTAFGDQRDRPLKKASGEWTYFAGDIAYHQNKMDRGFSFMINVWGADHASHVDRVKAAVQAISRGKATLEVLLAQIVHFVKDGAPLKMSKRAGTFVTVRDVVEQIGPDAFRFLMVSRKHDSQFTLNLNQAVEQSKDNPVFYVQYAHARACSVFRMARDLFPGQDLSVQALEKADLLLLQEEAEFSLIKALADWPRQLENAARTREPHRIVSFLEEVAHRFHSLWNKGTKETVLRFLLPEDLPLTLARLALLQGMIFVLASGLGLLGVQPVEEMR